MENSGRLTFGVYNGAKTTLRSGAAYNDNRWHHVVATQGASGMRLYVDGVAVGSNSVAKAQNYAGVWHVGGDNLNGWPNQPTSSYFRGQIDETAIYDTPLSPGQVADHYALSGAAPTVLTRGLSADAFVAENNATKSYGTANNLVSRGGTGARNISYLAFDVPAAPAGKTLTGATLRIRTSTDSASASADSFDLRVMSGAWNEASVNWTTRPTGVGSTVGRLTGARALNTFYDVTLDAAALRGLAGTKVTLAVLGSGTDNLRLSSREAAADSRPVLTFTYTS
jgi:hypothetical protein